MSFGFNSLTIDLKKILNSAYEYYKTFFPNNEQEIRFEFSGQGQGNNGTYITKYTRFTLSNTPPDTFFFILQQGNSIVYVPCNSDSTCLLALNLLNPVGKYVEIPNSQSIDLNQDLVNMVDVQGVIHGANYFGFPADTEYVPFVFDDDNNEDYQLDYEATVDIDCIVNLFSSIPSTINAPIESFGYDDILDKLQLMLSCSIMPFFLHLLQYMSFSLLYQRMIYMISLGLYIPRVGKLIPQYDETQYEFGYSIKKNIELQELNNPFTLLITQPPSYEDGTVPAYIADFVNVMKELVQSINNTNNRKLDILINSFGVSSDVNGYDTTKFRNVLNYQIELQTQKGNVETMISVDSIEESINTIVD